MEDTMSEPTKTDWTKTIAWQAGAPSQANALQCQKLVLEQQRELFDQVQQRMAAWTKRRQEALQTGLDALQRMSACKDPVSAATICGEWVSGSFSRIVEDMNDARDHALKMTEQFQKATQALFATEVPAEERSLSAPATLPADTSAPTPMREAAD
jgi:hypothetical protein